MVKLFSYLPIVVSYERHDIHALPRQEIFGPNVFQVYLHDSILMTSNLSPSSVSRSIDSS